MTTGNRCDKPEVFKLVDEIFDEALAKCEERPPKMFVEHARWEFRVKVLSQMQDVFTRLFRL